MCAGLFGSLFLVGQGCRGLSKDRGKPLSFTGLRRASQFTMLPEELAQQSHPGDVHSSYVLAMVQTQGAGSRLGQPRLHPDENFALSQWLSSELLTARSIGSSHLLPEVKAFSL